MSVPLDRLYNFLHDVCNRDDIIIYRFFPHGSRKLEDLKQLTNRDYNWFELMTMQSMICHDQEPLNYNLYSQSDFYPTGPDQFHGKLDNSKVNDLIANMHFRSLVALPFNGNDQVLLCHSEKNSEEIKLFEQNHFVGVYYWSHALIARDWFRYANLDPALTVDFNHIDKDFLIYNRAWTGTREYRLTFVEMLLNQDLQKFCHTTFNQTDSGIHYTNHVFSNQNLSIGRNDLEHYFAPNTVDASSSADYNSKDYAQTAIEIVLETLFDDQRQHLTEKALRPIACGRPFMLAATANSLQYLRDYGFETFDGLIDESYDTVADPKLRLQMIVKEMKRLSSLDADSKLKLWQQAYQIAARNKKLFFSEHWHNRIVSEFEENFKLAVQKTTSTGKYWNQLQQLIAQDPEKQKMQKSENLGFRTSKDLENFTLWLASRQTQ